MSEEDAQRRLPRDGQIQVDTLVPFHPNPSKHVDGARIAISRFKTRLNVGVTKNTEGVCKLKS
jgi:hypothetical protein